IGHGYGARGDADPTRLLPGSACIYPCARGLGKSPFGSETAFTTPEHVVYGIESRDTYIHGGCVDDYLCAATVLQGLFPRAARQLYYDGGSFGGGIGALLLAWDLRFRAGMLRVPSFGHYPLRVTLPCKGSGRAITERYERDPGILEVLRYFDAASAARFITTPTLISAALFDPSVPPPGQFAVYNALRLPERHLYVISAGHHAYPEQEAEMETVREAKIAFLTAMLSREPGS
ncbi:MAG TPA: acetylxylan esterase, partial [Chthoniobacteraceae bacterium]|nr:acetylxylan esterase [Chthoniobacteraceae bacterium]